MTVCADDGKASHFRLLNRLCESMAKEDPHAAAQLHHDLLCSGMDRILVVCRTLPCPGLWRLPLKMLQTLRKASTAYYPTVHLELARYVSLLAHASPNGKLPHLIDRLIGPPPQEVRKRSVQSQWLRGLDAIDLGRHGGRRGGWDEAI